MNLKKIITGILFGLSIPVMADTAHDSVVWEKLKDNTARLQIVGYVNPHPSVLGQASVWSVGAETMDRNYAIFDNYKEYLGQTGVGYARLQSGWQRCEPEKGKYDFEWLDKHVEGCLEQGVQPWMCLCYGNKIYATEHDLGAAIFSEGPTMDAWVRYVKEVAKRYKGKVTMYEVWNEPERDEYPELYARLFVNTAKAIRSVDKDVKIAGFGAISPEHSYIRKALDKIQEYGGIKYMDYLTYHAYWPTPEDITDEVIRLKEDVDRYSPSIRLLQGETGCPAQLEYGHALYSYEWTETSQAKWDCRNMLNHFRMGIPYSVFTMVDLHYGWMMQSFGLLRMNLRKEFQYKRPKYYMVRNVTSVFDGSMKASEDIEIEHNSTKKVSSYALVKNGTKVGFAIWFNGEIPSNSLERDLLTVKVNGLGLKDPVYVDMITGTVHSLASRRADLGFDNPEAVPERKNHPDFCKFKELPVWDAPILVIERSAIDIVETDPNKRTTDPFWPNRY